LFSVKVGHFLSINFFSVCKKQASITATIRKQRKNVFKGMASALKFQSKFTISFCPLPIRAFECGRVGLVASMQETNTSV